MVNIYKTKKEKGKEEKKIGQEGKRKDEKKVREKGRQRMKKEGREDRQKEFNKYLFRVYGLSRASQVIQ